MPTNAFNAEELRWMVHTGDGSEGYRINQQLSVLGYDRDAGTLDMVLRFDHDGGHCIAHRHLTTTSVLVLEGEQHVTDMNPDGSAETKVRRAGEYHFTTGDPLPHMERGGPEGALVFYGHHTTDGRLYDLVDQSGNTIVTVTLDGLVEAFETRAR